MAIISLLQKKIQWSVAYIIISNYINHYLSSSKFWGEKSFISYTKVRRKNFYSRSHRFLLSLCGSIGWASSYSAWQHYAIPWSVGLWYSLTKCSPRYRFSLIIPLMFRVPTHSKARYNLLLYNIISLTVGGWDGQRGKWRMVTWRWS